MNDEEIPTRHATDWNTQRIVFLSVCVIALAIFIACVAIPGNTLSSILA